MLKLSMCINSKGKYGEYNHLTRGKVYEVIADNTETFGTVSVITDNNEPGDYPRKCFGEKIVELTDEEVKSFREACAKMLGVRNG